MPWSDNKIVIRVDKRLTGEHERYFNASMLNEIAIVVVGENMESSEIIIHLCDGSNRQSIGEIHGSYDAIQWRIIFCRAENGYTIVFWARWLIRRLVCMQKLKIVGRMRKLSQNVFRHVTECIQMYQFNPKTNNHRNIRLLYLWTLTLISKYRKLFVYQLRNKQKGKLDGF